MPELPEVETIKNKLSPNLKGKTILGIKVLKPHMFWGSPTQVEGQKIIKISRRAKMLVVHLQKRLLVFHLKMSGQLLWEENNPDLPGKYTRIIFTFKNNSRLFFNDVRTFGWVKILTEKEFKAYTDKLGPEPLGKEFTSSYLRTILKKSKRAVKQVLLDQSKIAGIGNIYANEALFLAGVYPQKESGRLTAREISRLYQAIRQVLVKAIKYQGSSAKDRGYKLPSGKLGSYQEHFLVYQQQDKNCPRCQTKIKRIKTGGRSSFYCPKCQK